MFSRLSITLYTTQIIKGPELELKSKQIKMNIYQFDPSKTYHVMTLRHSITFDTFDKTLIAKDLED